MKKICLIMPNVFPVPTTFSGGVEILMNILLDENEKEKKIDLICVTIYEEKSYELSKKYKNTKFIHIKDAVRTLDMEGETLKEVYRKYLDKTYENIKDLEFDYVIFEASDPLVLEAGYLIKKLPNNTYIHHFHSADGMDILEKADYLYKHYICVSKFCINKMKTEFPEINSDKIKLLYNSIYLEKFVKRLNDTEKNEIKSKYGITNEDNVITFTGRTVKEKGIEELILAFKQMKNRQKCKLLIIGNNTFGTNIITPFDEKLKEISNEFQNQIIFTGFIKNEDLYKIHNITDIFVVPSLYEEAFGLVLVEAMASGLPIITTNIGGIPEVVNKDCAFILDVYKDFINNLSNKLDFLFENPEIRQKFGNEAEILSKKYSREEYYNNFVKLIESLKA